MATDDPEPDERVCFNCKHMIWGVALGVGVLCRHPAKRRADGRLFAIPTRRYSCKYFEARHGAAGQAKGR